MATAKTVGERLRSQRKNLGMSLVQLGAIVGVSHTTIMRWETNKTPIPTTHINKLATALELTASELLHGQNTERITQKDKAAYHVRRQRSQALAIQDARLERGMTQTELAAATGMNVTHLSRIENAERAPTARQRFLIERTLGLRLRNDYTDMEAFLMCRRVPGECPAGLAKWLQEGGAQRAGVSWLQVVMMTGMARHPEYWQPRTAAEWDELAEACRRDYGEVEWQLLPRLHPQALLDLLSWGEGEVSDD